MVSIISVNYNGYKDTCELIESLQEHETYPYEIIIVDNASKNNEGEKLKNAYPDITIICSKENLGFAKGNNLGIRYAKGEYLLFLNNDTIITSPILEKLIKPLQERFDVGCVSPKTTFWPDSNLLQYAGATAMSRITLRNKFIGYRQPDNPIYNHAQETAFANGAAMIIRSKDIKYFGEIPECYFLYYEELDWCMQMKNTGFIIWYEPTAVVGHKESATIGMESPVQVYYHNRNRYIFAQRNISDSNEKILSYLYQTMFAIPKRFLSYILQAKFNLLIPLLKGTKDGIKYILNIKTI